MTPDQLADELIELRRYCRTNPNHVLKAFEKLADEFDLGPVFFSLAGVLSSGVGSRLWGNLAVGCAVIHCDPEVLEGYLYAAAFELRCEADRMRPKEVPHA